MIGTVRQSPERHGGSNSRRATGTAQTAYAHSVSSSDTVTLRFPRALLPEIPVLASDLIARMHDLLERNTEGVLSPVERAELETLVKMGEFAQLLALAAIDAKAA